VTGYIFHDRPCPDADLLQEEISMNRNAILFGAVAGLVFSGAANAHTLQLDCHKTNADSVVCRTLMSDGEVLRDVSVQLVDENHKVLSNGKTDVKGQYVFKAPAGEYNVVVVANKAHVASKSSEDIW
jgi:hypothetical protein